jgi:hypothetical protein
VNTQIVGTPEEGREQVRRLKAAGADFVKAYDLLSAETFAAIAEEAKAQGCPSPDTCHSLSRRPKCQTQAIAHWSMLLGW